MNRHTYGSYLVIWYLNQHHCRAHYSLTYGCSTWGPWQFFLHMFLKWEGASRCLSGKGDLVQKRLRTTTFTDGILAQFCSAWIQYIYTTCNFFFFGNAFIFSVASGKSDSFLWVWSEFLEVEWWWGTGWLRHMDTFIFRLLLLTRSWKSLPSDSYYLIIITQLLCCSST